MITYVLSVKMADHSLAISDEIMKIIAACAKEANKTTASRREKRTFELTKRQDEYTIIITIKTKNPVIPTRSLSTITRQILKNEFMADILRGRTPNGCVFDATVIDEFQDKLPTKNLNDVEIVNEIISIFFSKPISPIERSLNIETANKIKDIIYNYHKEKNELT